RGLIGKEDLHLYKITDSVDEATREITNFYSNFHSVRYWRDDLVIRLHRRPTPAQLAEISAEFADVKTRGEFRVSDPLPIERDEPSLMHLPRLVFAFNRRDHGK